MWLHALLPPHGPVNESVVDASGKSAGRVSEAGTGLAELGQREGRASGSRWYDQSDAHKPFVKTKVNCSKRCASGSPARRVCAFGAGHATRWSIARGSCRRGRGTYCTPEHDGARQAPLFPPACTTSTFQSALVLLPLAGPPGSGACVDAVASRVSSTSVLHRTTVSLVPHYRWPSLSRDSATLVRPV